MTQIKIERGKFFALADYSDKWYPFWNQDKVPEDIKKTMSEGKEYSIDKEVSFGCCGKGYMLGSTICPCSPLWPNPNCAQCSGYGGGAEFD